MQPLAESACHPFDYLKKISHTLSNQVHHFIHSQMWKDWLSKKNDLWSLFAELLFLTSSVLSLAVCTVTLQVCKGSWTSQRWCLRLHLIQECATLCSYNKFFPFCSLMFCKMMSLHRCLMFKQWFEPARNSQLVVAAVSSNRLLVAYKYKPHFADFQ